jgi:hypothetical protein
VTGLAILAALSVLWRLLLTLWAARAGQRVLKRVPTLEQQTANLERLQALAESLKAGLDQLAELDRHRQDDVNAIKLLRNYRNN